MLTRQAIDVRAISIFLVLVWHVGAVLTNDSKFRIIDIEWIDDNSFEIRWFLDETLSHQSIGFTFAITGDDNRQVFNYPASSRFTVIHNISSEYQTITAFAKFSDVSELVTQFDLPRKCAALYSWHQELFCCEDDLCHDNIPLFSTDSKIMAICYGDTLMDLFAVTESYLISHDMKRNQSKLLLVPTQEAILTMDYDWLNRLVMIITRHKIYQIDFHKRLTFVIQSDHNYSFVDGIVDPVNGFIHIIAVSNGNHSYIATPSIILQNVTLSKVVSHRLGIPTSYSLLLDDKYSSLNILGKDFLQRYFFENSTLLATRLSLDTPAKLQKDSHGFLAWRENITFQFELQNGIYTRNSIEMQIERYTNYRSTYRNIPEPNLPMTIEDSFFNYHDVTVAWHQPYDPWKSRTGWKKYNYTVSIKSNNSLVHIADIGTEKYFNKKGLEPDRKYELTIALGRHSQTVTGKTISSSAENKMLYFVFENGTPRAYTLQLEQFNLTHVGHFLERYSFVKEMRIFDNSGFILFQNGTIIKTNPDVIITKVTQELLAKRFEVDYETGNIYFIDLFKYGIYRNRPVGNGHYRVDQIITTPVDDMTIFSSENLLVFTSKGITYFTDLNGFPVNESRKLLVKTSSFQCYGDLLKRITLSNKKRILSSSRRPKKCFATSYGLVRLSPKGIYLQNWDGNSSLTLRNISNGISGVGFVQRVNYSEILAQSIDEQSITVSRSESNNIWLSWKQTKEFNYSLNLTNLNRAKSWQLTARFANISIREYGICNDTILVTIRTILKSTYGDQVARQLSIPCSTGPALIENVFVIKKMYSSSETATIEMQMNITTNIPSDIIDGKYPCHIRVSFIKSLTGLYKNQYLQNTKISCMEKLFRNSLIIDKNHQFKWSNFCVEIDLSVSSTRFCIPIDILESSNTEIVLPLSQKIVTTFLEEVIRKIYISQNRRSIFIMDQAGNNRPLIETDASITKLEIDWLRNNLFWSEEDNGTVKIFSASYKNNERNLFDNRLIWFVSNKTKTIWTTNTISRKILITANGKEMTFNLDYGPGWTEDHDSLVKCWELRKRKNATKCVGGNNEKFIRPIKTCFLRDREIMCEHADRNVCKLSQVKDNYFMPANTWNCTNHFYHNVGYFPSAMIYSNGDNGTVIVDDEGYAYDRLSSPIQMDMSFETIVFGINITCFRFSAQIRINSTFRGSDYFIYIYYKHNQAANFSRLNLLSNNIANIKSNYLNINGLLPGRIYQFGFEIISMLTNISMTNFLNCSTMSDVPGPPHNPIVNILNETHLEISWLSSMDNGYQIIDYQIYSSQKSSDWKMTPTTTKETKLAIAKPKGYMEISIKARNKLGLSLPSYAYLNDSGTSKQFINLGSYFSASSSIFIFMMIMLIATVILFSWIFVKRIIQKRISKYKESSLNHFNHSLEMQNIAQNIKYEANCLYNFEKLPLSNFDKIPHVLNECLTYSHLIGNGAFGMVFKGMMEIESDNNKTTFKPVALKIRNGKSISEDDFKREAVLLYKYFHPNIIELFGVSFDCPDKQCLILEYMEKGNLRQFLQHHRPDVIRQRMINNPKRKIINENSILDVKDLINIALDILEALKYLENHHFVHRDIAARNCLVSYQNKKQRITKLGDFGLARDIYSDEYYRKVSETKLPVRWMAPETIKDSIFTGKSDVWSFGVLCWEIITFGADPYMGQANAEVIKDVIDGKHLDRPENCPIKLYEIMLQCWKYYAECRPTFSEIDLLFQYLDDMKDVEDVSTLSRLVMRTYNSSHESEFGRNSDPVTEKTSIAISDKYADVVSLPFKQESIPVQYNYDNLAYDIHASPLSMNKQNFPLLNEIEDTVDKSNDG